MVRAKTRKKRKNRSNLTSWIWLLAAISMILVGFFLPWLDYRCSGFDEVVFGCPVSQMVPGWRLPLFAHEAEQAWIVRVAQIFQADGPDRTRVWLVYVSPLAGLLALGCMWGGKKLIYCTLIVFANALVLFLLVVRLQQPMPAPPLIGLEVKLGIGILLTTCGHAFLIWILLSQLKKR